MNNVEVKGHQGRSPLRLAGVSGGVVASVCCVAPPAAIAMGAGAGSIFIVFGRYRPLFYVAGGLMALALGLLVARRQGQACPLEERRTWCGNALMTTFIGFAVTAFFGRVVIPQLIERL